MGDKLYSTGNRRVGSEVDIALGQTVIFDASGFWKEYIGLVCTYVVEYVNDILFTLLKCKKPTK